MDRSCGLGADGDLSTILLQTRDLSTLEEAGIGYDRDSVIQLSLFCSLIQAPDNTWKTLS